MKTIDLISTSFDVNRTTEYRMSIREFTDGFSFCVVDNVTRECVAIKRTHKKEYQKIWEEEPLLQLPYKSIVIQIEHSVFAFVPEALFLEQKASEYLPLSRQRRTRCQLKIDSIDDYKVKLLYDIRHSEFRDNSVTYIHPLHYLVTAASKHGDSTLVVDIQENNADIVFIQNKRLILANQYRIKEAEDIVYQVMALLSRFDVDPEKIECIIWGEEELLEKSLAILKEYIRNIHKPEIPNNWNYQFNKQLYWEFTTQIETIGCE